MPVTLCEDDSGAGVFSAARKNGSSLQDASGAGWGRGGGGADGGAADCGGETGLAGALKNCVNPPSAESDTPGDENPLARDGPDDGTDPMNVAEDMGAGRWGSSLLRGGGVWVDGGVTSETKMRVNSPGGWSGTAGGGVGYEGALNTAVGASVAGWTGGGAGRCPCELNIWVNSPCPVP